jgi:hypothetical protein
MELSGLQDQGNTIYSSSSPVSSGLAKKFVPSAFSVAALFAAQSFIPLAAFRCALFSRQADRFVIRCARMANPVIALSRYAWGSGASRYSARTADQGFNKRIVDASIEWSGFTDRFLQYSS